MPKRLILKQKPKQKKRSVNKIKKESVNIITEIKTNPIMLEKTSSPEEPKQTEGQPTPAEQKEETKQLPADIFSDQLPPKEILPLEVEVIKKDYAALPENVSELQAGGQSTDSGKSISEDPENPTPPASSQPKMTPAEEGQAAKQTVDMFFRGYEKLHGFGRYIGKIDDGKLTQLDSTGKIDLSIKIPIGKEPVTYGEFFEQYNSSIDKNIIITDDFKAAFAPPATREVIKRKLFIDDSIVCLLLIGEDILTKTSLLIGMKKSVNMVLESCIELVKNQNKKPTVNVTSPPTTETPPSADIPWKEPE